MLRSGRDCFAAIDFETVDYGRDCACAITGCPHPHGYTVQYNFIPQHSPPQRTATGAPMSRGMTVAGMGRHTTLAARMVVPVPAGRVSSWIYTGGAGRHKTGLRLTMASRRLSLKG